jgi:NAD(P)-dependent dehydrogenase (short-subunit alcohol dehydrogenase family)
MASHNTVSGPVDFSKAIDKSTVNGKVALVTGGASGIGAATSKALAEAGAIVVIADVNEEAGRQYVAELSRDGRQ